MNRLTLDILKESGGISLAPVDCKLKWTHNDEEVEFDVYVKKSTLRSQAKFLFDSESKGLERTDHLVDMVYYSICSDEKCTPMFESKEQIWELDTSLFFAMVGLVNEVNTKKN